jgi:copper resistance protein D
MSFQVFILWLHLLGVVVWIGGLCFQLLVVPAVLQHMPSAVEQLRSRLSFDIRFRSVMWSAVGLVLLTGLYNVMNLLYATTLAGGRLPSAFVQRLSIKLLLVVLMLLLHAVQRFVMHPRLVTGLTQLPADTRALPDNLLKLQRLSQLLSMLIVGIAVIVLLLGVLLRG